MCDFNHILVAVVTEKWSMFSQTRIRGATWCIRAYAVDSLCVCVCVCVCDDGSNQNCSCAYSCRVMVCAFVIMSYNIDILGGAGGVLFARHFT